MSSSKREEILHKALDIFYRDGFRATGMDKLVKETGISKTSMYKYFRTKDELILASLRLRDELFRNSLVRKIEEKGDDPITQILGFFDVLEEWFYDPDFRSCMFIKATGEYPERGQPVNNIAAEHKNLFGDYIRKLVIKTGATDPELLTQQILLLKEGAIVTAHIHGPKGVAQNAKLAASALLNTNLN
ncbi:MAG: TetR/AcrR family transcriptional regulator [Sneathiella sp.]